MTDWEDSYKLVKGKFEEHDVSPGIAMALSVKDEEEQVNSSHDGNLLLEIHSISLQNKSCVIDEVF